MIWLWLLACGGAPEPSEPSEPAPAPRLALAPVDAPGEDAQPPAPPAARLVADPRAPSPSGSHDAILTRDDCDQVQPGPSPADGCITGTLSCGDEIVGHTRGGVQRFDTRFYEKHFCTPSTSDHDGGGERVYRLQVPEGDWRVTLTLDTPCADLDLAAIRWDGPGCPDVRSKVMQCEMHRKDGTRREQFRISSRGGSTWLLVVEPNGEAEGAFGLRVTCEPGL